MTIDIWRHPPYCGIIHLLFIHQAIKYALKQIGFPCICQQVARTFFPYFWHGNALFNLPHRKQISTETDTLKLVLGIIVNGNFFKDIPTRIASYSCRTISGKVSIHENSNGECERVAFSPKFRWVCCATSLSENSANFASTYGKSIISCLFLLETCWLNIILNDFMGPLNYMNSISNLIGSKD